MDDIPDHLKRSIDLSTKVNIILSEAMIRIGEVIEATKIRVDGAMRECNVSTEKEKEK